METQVIRHAQHLSFKAVQSWHKDTILRQAKGANRVGFNCQSEKEKGIIDTVLKEKNTPHVERNTPYFCEVQLLPKVAQKVHAKVVHDMPRKK